MTAALDFDSRSRVSRGVRFVSDARLIAPRERKLMKKISQSASFIKIIIESPGQLITRAWGGVTYDFYLKI